MYVFKSFNPQDTFKLACLLGKKLKGGELIGLEGELGAGKTLFVKGLACGLGVGEPVTSPTFTLIQSYQGRLPLVHFDVYRLPVPEAIEELGYEEFFYGPGVTAVEWSDLIRPYLPGEYLQIIIKREYHPRKGEYRLITLVPHGKEMETLAEELIENAGAGN
ncbi:MAG: tRNA (adenosine(37)-N6)-threonylcarbamoyltransferase complex ATPase subunit type 1 TsaE [Peptococcaceae bacterium]|nr:tRNA (adenosine(37)-N6)-threonylcarbamoyltransferase complex ATPase subunit type 1 TsaE [Peptococcaceae bacterium]MDH7526112.1 tRNA (adenosine(37)-N6)-threonylcarbamoyltransferase complex ATPase subunit type 1 TsaE [Peptococcaceae bacterium]